MGKCHFLDFLVLRNLQTFSYVYLIAHGPARWVFRPSFTEEEIGSEKKCLARGNPLSEKRSGRGLAREGSEAMLSPANGVTLSSPEEASPQAVVLRLPLGELV